MSSLNQAYQLFIDEVPELLQAIETGLLNLQEDKSTPAIHSIMRAAHSLKGGAASVGLQIIKQIAHQLEDYFKALYDENLVVDTELENLFLEAYDCLAIPLRQQLETGDFDRQEAQKKIDLVSEKLAAKLGKALEQVENYLPSSEDLGIDIIASLFEVDVAQEIRRLKGLVASPESFSVEEELKECLTILKGLSEVADLPGFSMLINISEQAVEKHPDKTLTIASLLLNDLQISRDLVLNGDCTEGGNPCSSLLELAGDADAQLDNSTIVRIIKNQKTTMTVNDPVYQFFIAEVPDLLHSLETALLSIKKDKSISSINDLMRAAHSIKGGAASVGLDGIKNMAHKLEDYIKALFEETVVVDDELETYFLDAFDCLKNALSEQIEQGNYSLHWQKEAETTWQKLDQRLGSIENQDYLPSWADLGIDIVQSLFEVDVADVIKELQKGLENLPTTELVPVVNQQLDILSGLSEITDLPGFKQITNVSKQALLRHPEQAETITSLLIIDITHAQKQVLNGERTQGGKPSPELLALAEIPEENIVAEDSPMDLVEEVEEDNPSEENHKTTADFIQLVSELKSLEDEDDQLFSLSEIPEFTDLTNVEEMSVSESESAIFPPENLDNNVFTELIELPDSNLFNDNSPAENTPEEISEENILEEITTEDLFWETSEENIFEEITTEEILTDSVETQLAPIDSQQQELQAQSYQFFIEEAVDLIALIDDNLENVLANRNINDINEIARCAHSLKGGSRSAGLEDLGMIALRVEKSLKALFNENIPLTESLKSYLREIYQLLRQAVVARIDNQEVDEKTAAESANAMWAKFEAEYGEEIARAEEFLPSSSDLGIDIASSIFEVDVLEGITNLQQVLDSGSESELVETLTMQIEVFSGFGEMLALPGFSSICETTVKAIEENPQQLSAIAQAFINNLQIAREQVLQGDRVRGGEPSTELLTLAGKATANTAELSPNSSLGLHESEQVAQASRLWESEQGSGEKAQDSYPSSIEATPMPAEETTSPDTAEDSEASVDTTEPVYSFFIEEAPELLQIIENGLLNLREEERDTAKMHEIMRAAHSLKGGAATVGLEAIKTISHRLEDVFKVLYDPEIEVNTELETWLLESFDCLRNGLTSQIETGSYDAEAILTKANEIWAKIQTRLGNALSRADDYIPSSTELGVDIVQSMFEVDVAEELERLRSDITYPITQPLMGELRATLEVFAGFGEMLNLSGFFEIAQLGLQAIDKNPDHLIYITQIIINDVEKARDSVLKGDRTIGGKPSNQLVRLAEEEIAFNSETEPSLEDVFGEQSSQLDEVFQLTADDKETQVNIPTPELEEVFLMDSEDIQIEENLPIDSSGTRAELEDIFESELTPEEANFIARASELALDEDKNQTIPSLDKIFAFPEIDEIILEDDSHEIDSPKLDEVFASEIDNEDVFTIPEESEENEASPSLEDVFGILDDQVDEAKEEHKSSSSSVNQQSAIVDVSKQRLLDIPPEEKKEAQEENKAPEEKEELESAPDAPANLADALKSIGDIYPQLPGLKTDQDIKTTFKSTKATKSTSTSKSNNTTTVSPPTSAKTNLTIRVDLDRLERMNNLIGELSINRNGLSLQNNKLQNSVQELVERFGNFQKMANNLRNLSDKMLVSPEKFTSSSNPKNNLDSSLSLSDDDQLNLNSAFDALEMDRYDNLYNVMQDLIEQMIQLEEAVDDIALFSSQAGKTVEEQRQMLNRLRDELMWARMLPLGEILNRFPRVLRDLSVKYNKKVNLKIEGTNVLVDRAALEKLYDPLVHLIRNAFDHGIETPEVRKQRGKSPMGTIQVKAYHQGNQTIIEIKDDGNGLNLNKIGQKAMERNLLTAEQLAVISKENLLDLIFEPGFSTAAAVTEISGRGVGLDIVRSQLRALKGNISVDSEPGVGTTFILRLPLTLTIDKLLVLSTGAHFYALPSDNIEEIIVPESEQIKTSNNQRFLYYEHKVIPIYPLTDLLQYRCYLSDRSYANQSLEILPTPEEWGNPLLILNLGKELFAIEVEHLVSEQELVIKPFGKSLSAPSYTYGCTILGDGTLIPVVNTATLLTSFLQSSQGDRTRNLSNLKTHPIKKSVSPQPVKTFQAASVLVVDDSAAMRRTLALSLEKAGYRVVQAKDGKEALEQLQQMNNISLVICDIEMPNMNGFEFLGQRRRYPELNKIPVAMLTSRSNDKHRKLATHLGANAYFTKPYIEQKFLQSIKSLIDEKSLATI